MILLYQYAAGEVADGDDIKSCGQVEVCFSAGDCAVMVCDAVDSENRSFCL